MQIPGYRDLTVLGRGGFSTVYRARQESVQRDVALKVLAVHMAGADAKARFGRECATNGRVGTHPNIVTLFDSGFADDGSPYLAMQLCGGGSLSERMRSSGPLPIADVLRIGVKISAALQYAHSAGVLHRDIKPENILISDFGEPELADFGISSVDDQRLSTVTASSFTINHAAPEALAGRPSSVATDIYSLSSTLFTLVAGHTPFLAPSSTAVVALVDMVMNSVAPSTGRADTPDSLERLLAAGLSKNPDDRPVDAKAVGAALQQIQRELGLPVTEFPSAPPPLTVSPTQTLSGLGAAGLAGAAGAAGPARGAGPATGAMPPTGARPMNTQMPGFSTGAMPPTGALPGPEPGSASTQWANWADEAGNQPSRLPPSAADRDLGPVVPPPSGPPPGRTTNSSATPPSRPDRRAWWILGAVLAVLIVGAGIYFTAIRNSSSARDGAVAPISSATSSPASSGPASTGSSAQPTSSSSSSSSSNRSSSSSPRSSTSSTPSTAALAVINSFGSTTYPDGSAVDCATATSSVDIPLTWDTTAAAQGWVAIDSSGRDASMQPYDSNVPPAVSDFSLPFTCSAAQHVYTLTIANADGKKTSRSMTLQAKFPDSTSESSATPSSSPSSSSSSTSSTPTTPTTPPTPPTPPSTPTTPSTPTSPTTPTTSSAPRTATS